jgi:hypothetical protein
MVLARGYLLRIGQGMRCCADHPEINSGTATGQIAPGHR